MSGALGIVLFVFVILLVIVVHEAGHFTMAKTFGMKVEEFFLGFGPRLWSFRRGETEYGVKAVPLGGYVRITGMNPFQEAPPEDIPRSYATKPAWQRSIVIIAGPITHFVIAMLCFTVYFAAIGVTEYRPVIDSVDARLPGVSGASPATVAGLKAGDVIVGVGTISDPTREQFSAYVQDHVGTSVPITVRRDGRTLTLHATPVVATIAGSGTYGRVGVITSGGERLGTERAGPVAAIGKAGQLFWSVTAQMFSSLGTIFGPAGISRLFHLLGGAPRQATDPTGIVGGARIADQAARAGSWQTLLLLFAEFNIFVGIINLLPLPPLDGGHLAVIAVEKVTRRRIDPQRLVPVAAVVMGFLVLFTLSMFYLDIVNPLPNPFR